MTRTIEVWYKLDDASPDKVKVEDGADVADLKDAVKAKWGNRLFCAAPELLIFAADKDDPLGPGDTVPNDTTVESPLIVKSPQQQEEVAAKRGDDNWFVTAMRQLSLDGRRASCRLWVGDRTVYNLRAASFRVFDEQVRSKFSLPKDAEISYYIIPQKKDVDSRQYISNDDDLDGFFDLAGKPTIFVWPRGNPSLSPKSLPSEVEIHASSADSVSTSTSSSRGYIQKAFREAVRLRDNNKCVLSGEPVRSKAGNVEAAHIFGVEPALTDRRRAAGILNGYDTSNGMLLEKSLHVAFDAYQCRLFWCALGLFCV